LAVGGMLHVRCCVKAPRGAALGAIYTDIYTSYVLTSRATCYVQHCMYARTADYGNLSVYRV
jgi:hypothetical protein